MLYEELHQRFGSYISKRVQLELGLSEFNQVVIADLSHYLNARAETAHKDYQARLDNPLIHEEQHKSRAQSLDSLYHRWRDAEDLAYLVSVAVDVGAATSRTVANNQG